MSDNPVGDALDAANAVARHRIDQTIATVRAGINDLQADNDRLRKLLTTIRFRLHAANRPTLREGLRVELRDMIDAELGTPS